MKSVGDIQKLADSALETIASNQASEAHPSIYKEGFVDGYEQCESESIKKYTLEDMKKMFNSGCGDNDHLGFDYYINKI